MSLMAIKAAILTLSLGCAGGPDEFELGYGHIWQGDSSLEGWKLANDDSDMVTIGLVWKLKPTEVIVRNPVGQEVRFPPVPPDLTLTQDAEEASHEEIEEHLVQDLTEAVDAFDAFGTVTKIGFLLLAGFVLWTYRERLGRLIPGGRNGEKKG